MTRFRVVLLMILLVFSCASLAGAAQSTKDVTASDDLKAKARQSVLGDGAGLPVQDPEYVVGHGDLLEVQVYGEGSMAVSAPAPSPTDYSFESASNSAVVLKKSFSKLYTVMGKVASPGVYNIEQPINLVQVIARAGGFTEWANSELTVVRENGNKGNAMFAGNTLKFDYDDFLAGRDLEKNIVIQSGDIIIVH